MPTKPNICAEFERNRWFELYQLLPGFLMDTLLILFDFMIWFDLFDSESPQLVGHSCSARMTWDLNKAIIIIIIII